MAIAPTGAVFHSLTFGSVNSANYGIYITGQAVYNAPTRAVEMVDVPGRNGQIALDQGRWENIEITYPAGCFADSESDFRNAISAFRNAVVSQLGYQRLTDTYNPNEYRMGVYMDGLEVKPSMLRAGQFNIVFNCKPQRWLTSGETETTITNSGDTITNPTQYASSPLLQIYGYGAVAFNGYEIELRNELIGEVVIADNYKGSTVNYQRDMFEDGDDIRVKADVLVYLNIEGSTYTTPSITDSDAHFETTFLRADGKRLYFKCMADLTFAHDTDRDATYTNTITFNFTVDNVAYTATATYTIKYLWGNTSTPAHFWSYGSSSAGVSGVYSFGLSTFTYDSVIGDSTASVLGDPPHTSVYVDCDLGECYRIASGEIIDLNRYIDLGSDLPELASGSNAVTFDNTVTMVNVTPRWWKL